MTPGRIPCSLCSIWRSLRAPSEPSLLPKAGRGFKFIRGCCPAAAGGGAGWRCCGRSVAAGSDPKRNSRAAAAPSDVADFHQRRDGRPDAACQSNSLPVPGPGNGLDARCIWPTAVRAPVKFQRPDPSLRLQGRRDAQRGRRARRRAGRPPRPVTLHLVSAWATDLDRDSRGRPAGNRLTRIRDSHSRSEFGSCGCCAQRRAA